MPPVDLHGQVLQEANALAPLLLAVAAVAGELDEVEGVGDRQGARGVADEREARLQRADQQGIEPGVVLGNLPPQLGDSGRDLVCVEEDLGDSAVERYDAFRRPYRAASRSKSRS
jgi:hypothetical protein